MQRRVRSAPMTKSDNRLLAYPANRYLGAGAGIAVHGCIFGADPQSVAGLYGHRARRVDADHRHYRGRGRSHGGGHQGVLGCDQRLSETAQDAGRDRLRAGGDHQIRVPAGDVDRMGVRRPFCRPHRQRHPRCPTRRAGGGHHPARAARRRLRSASGPRLGRCVSRSVAGAGADDLAGQRHPRGDVVRGSAGRDGGGAAGVFSA